MFTRPISWLVIVTFIFSVVGPYKPAHADNVLGLPAPGSMIDLSPAYQPVIIRGLTVHKDNPFLFDFIVDVGQDKMSGAPLKKEGEKLIKYFLASLAIPDKDVWVNLSPYEKDRMIPEALGQTDMGRDLLEQDYILKQLTASLIYPEKQLGKEFWNKVYAKAQAEYGTTQIPVNTFNKVWIMADRAEVFEHNQTAFVVDQHLKVMLEEDYLALSKHSSLRGGEADAAISNNKSHIITSSIIRQIVLPELEKEVNTGKNFANLRQIVNSLILANWYKKNLKEALLNQVYTNQSKIKGIDLNDPTIKQQIYDQYLKAYKKGVFNYIKEDVLSSPNASVGDPHTTISRKYFSGGFLEGKDFENAAMTSDPTELARTLPEDSGRLEDFATIATQNPKVQSPNAAMSSIQELELRPQLIDERLADHFFGKAIDLGPFAKYLPENYFPEESMRTFSAHPSGIGLVKEETMTANWGVVVDKSKFIEILRMVAAKDMTLAKKIVSQNLDQKAADLFEAEQVILQGLHDPSNFLRRTQALEEAADTGDFNIEVLADVARELMVFREGDDLDKKMAAVVASWVVLKHKPTLGRELGGTLGASHILYIAYSSSEELVSASAALAYVSLKMKPSLFSTRGDILDRLAASFWGSDLNSFLMNRLAAMVDQNPTEFVGTDFLGKAYKIINAGVENIRAKRSTDANDLYIVRQVLERKPQALKRLGSRIAKIVGWSTEREDLKAYVNARLNEGNVVAAGIRLKQLSADAAMTRQGKEPVFINPQVKKAFLKVSLPELNDYIQLLYQFVPMRLRGVKKEEQKLFLLPQDYLGMDKNKRIDPMVRIISASNPRLSELDKLILVPATADDLAVLRYYQLRGRKLDLDQILVLRNVAGILTTPTQENSDQPWASTKEVMKAFYWIGLERAITQLGMEKEFAALLEEGKYRFDNAMTGLDEQTQDHLGSYVSTVRENGIYKRISLNDGQIKLLKYRTGFTVEIEMQYFYGKRRQEFDLRTNDRQQAMQVYEQMRERVVRIPASLSFGFLTRAFNKVIEKYQYKKTVADFTRWYRWVFNLETGKKSSLNGEMAHDKKELMRVLGQDEFRKNSQAQQLLLILRNSGSVFFKGRIDTINLAENIVDSGKDAAMRGDQNEAVLTKIAPGLTRGGIDLNTSNGMQWKISKDGNGVEMNIDPAMIARIKEHGIESLSPVVFRITPVVSVWPLLGLKDPQTNMQLAKA